MPRSESDEPPNKRMKLTEREHIEVRQLILSVRPTVREQHEEAAPGMSTAPSDWFGRSGCGAPEAESATCRLQRIHAGSGSRD